MENPFTSGLLGEALRQLNRASDRMEGLLATEKAARELIQSFHDWDAVFTARGFDGGKIVTERIEALKDALR